MSQPHINVGDKNADSAAQKVPVLLLGTIVALLFVFFRVLGAYWLQNSTNEDYSTVVLMAKHMAQGTEFPLFFYGQAYMGSLEPMMSALLCRIAGFSGFTVCMGTVLFSVAMMPFLYLLGRNCGGWTVGMLAVVFCSIGPSGFFHYTSSPRGGYGALLFFSVALLWAILKVTRLELQGHRVSMIAYVGIGLLGGLAFWVDPLVVPAILAGSLIYLLYLRKGAFSRKGPYLACASFFIGLGPFLFWNARHGWKTLEMVTQTTRSLDFTKGLRLFFARMATLLDFGHSAWYWSAPLAVLYIAALIYSISLFCGSFRDARSGRRTVVMGGLLAYFAIYAVCFSYSDFAYVDTPRYLLPLVPVIGILCAVVISSLKRWRLAFAYMALLAVCLSQATQLRVFRDMHNTSLEALKDASALSEYLVRNELGVIYSFPGDQYLNHTLDEKYLFCSRNIDSYLPYAERGERAKTVAMLNALDEDARMLSSAGISYVSEAVSGHRIWHDFKREECDIVALPTGSINAITDMQGDDLSARLTDRCLLTGWSATSSNSLIITLNEATPVSGIRFLCRPQHYPRRWLLEARESIGGEWKDLIEETSLTPFFWSGARPYARGSFFRAEGFASATLCRQLRIRFPQTTETALRLSEIQLYAPLLQSHASSQAGIDDLAIWLERNRADVVFADRWESNQLFGKCDAEIIRDRMYAGEGADLGVPMKLSSGLALIVKNPDVPWTRYVLNGYGLSMSESVVGQWTIFTFGPGQWRDEYRSATGLVWIGFGCAIEAQKHRALSLAGIADSEYRIAGRKQDALISMGRAMQAYPNYRDGAGRMAVWLNELGRYNEAAVWQQRYERMWRPSVDANVDFAGRASLVGVSVAQVSVSPGSELRLKFFWRCSPDARARNLVAFVHFKRGKAILFQDDRSFLAEKSILYQPFDEVFVEERSVAVPYNVTPGECEMWLGVYDVGSSNNRLRPRSDFQHKKKAVLLPVVLQVNGPQT